MNLQGLTQLIKKYPYPSIAVVIIYLTLIARVQADAASMLERTVVNFSSGLLLAVLMLYFALYLTGSLNPGDKAIVDFKGFFSGIIYGKSKK